MQVKIFDNSTKQLIIEGSLHHVNLPFEIGELHIFLKDTGISEYPDKPKILSDIIDSDKTPFVTKHVPGFRD